MIPPGISNRYQATVYSAGAGRLRFLVPVEVATRHPQIIYIVVRGISFELPESRIINLPAWISKYYHTGDKIEFFVNVRGSDFGAWYSYLKPYNYTSIDRNMPQGIVVYVNYYVEAERYTEAEDYAADYYMESVEVLPSGGYRYISNTFKTVRIFPPLGELIPVEELVRNFSYHLDNTYQYLATAFKNPEISGGLLRGPEYAYTVNNVEFLGYVVNKSLF